MVQAEEKRKYKILIDQRPFEVDDQFITGAQIKAKVGAPTKYGVWIKVSGSADDKEIADNEKVDLSQPGREHFFTGSKTTTEG